MRGLFAVYKPAPTATRKRPMTSSGHGKILAMAVLPQYQKPTAASTSTALNSQTIFAEKTSALAQSVLILMMSIAAPFFFGLMIANLPFCAYFHLLYGPIFICQGGHFSTTWSSSPNPGLW